MVTLGPRPHAGTTLAALTSNATRGKWYLQHQYNGGSAIGDG